MVRGSAVGTVGGGEDGGLYCLVFKSSLCHLASGVDGWGASQLDGGWRGEEMEIGKEGRTQRSRVRLIALDTDSFSFQRITPTLNLRILVFDRQLGRRHTVNGRVGRTRVLLSTQNTTSLLFPPLNKTLGTANFESGLSAGIFFSISTSLTKHSPREQEEKVLPFGRGRKLLAAPDIQLLCCGFKVNYQATLKEKPNVF